jgi:hypothetical protein
VHDLALRVVDEPDLGSTLTHLTADLDSLWTQFRLEDDAMLDGLTDLDRLSEYDIGLTAEIRKCISDCKVAAAKLVPKGVEAIDMSYLQAKLGSSNPPQESDQNPLSRLPAIPLPEFGLDHTMRFVGCRLTGADW